MTLLAEIESHRAPPPGGRAPYRIAGQRRRRRRWSSSSSAPAATIWRRGFPPAQRCSSTASSAASASAGRSPIPSCSTRAATGDGLLPVYPPGPGAQPAAGCGGSSAPRSIGCRSCPNGCRDRCSQRHGWPGWAQAVRAMPTGPRTPLDLEPGSAGAPAPRLRRAAGEPAGAGTDASRPGAGCPAARCAGDGSLADRLLARPALPAAPPASSRADRRDRRASWRRRRRCCGCCRATSAAARRVVALAAMLQAVEAGAQAALMAPTEVLARQHAATVAGDCWRRWASRSTLLTGKDPPPQRRAALERLADRREPRSRSARTRCSRTASRSAIWGWR